MCHAYTEHMNCMFNTVRVAALQGKTIDRLRDDVCAVVMLHYLFRGPVLLRTTKQDSIGRGQGRTQV